MLRIPLAAVLVLVVSLAAAPAARADGVNDLLQSVPPLVEAPLREAVDLATAVTFLARDATVVALDTAEALSHGAVNDAAALAIGLEEDAGALVVEAIGTAAHLPDPAVAEARRKLDDLQAVPPVLGAYVQRRVDAVPALDEPLVRDAGATVSPHVEALGSALTAEVAVSAPIGGVPSVGLGLGTAPPPDPGAVALDVQGLGERSAAHAAAWAAAQVDDTAATAGEAVALVVR